MLKAMLVLAACLVMAGSSLAFDDATQALVDRQKPGKALTTDQLAQVMLSSERWCYREDAGTCGWTGIYLHADKTGAQFEIANSWSADIDIAYQQSGTFSGRHQLCETDAEWVSTMRATHRGDGSAIGGRELAALKADIAAVLVADTDDCFNYLYRSADPRAQTISLLQRQYVEARHNPDQDVTVTVHFDAQSGAALTTRW